jgi:hypothetical protein
MTDATIEVIMGLSLGLNGFLALWLLDTKSRLWIARDLYKMEVEWNKKLWSQFYEILGDIANAKVGKESEEARK